MQAKAQEIRKYLEAHGLPCWADLCVRGQSRMRTRSTSSLPDITANIQLSHIQRSMRAAAVVLSCITPKYIQSDNCHKDLQLAETLQKPLVPVLLHFLAWPPNRATPHIRRLLLCYHPIDLSNDRLFRRNLSFVLSRIKLYVKN
nr:PREDICTED: uncharacterized protein LOC106703658 [Latimeria chalumnae]|eukprot:XP_014344441.1 PREDICTED: uncharacterized protein LOC106703658 [Latimeria chalumnae]